ncbi:ribbon-helix-helix domain-containing protein [Methylobacterium frigidaeris]|uniref:Uncharacterized protein n=1 Tax=Methylobacterium frigidaeris TaxID=2038277 RepID=A0AA37HG83_9HYPH|nr:ribbon-helix-helix domain-containing protein [Methylobacterium frigidaeris]GJD65204.1 hypothetical protein MPEAHAMD_5391 [Methylobacterium frigidaeris]
MDKKEKSPRPPSMPPKLQPNTPTDRINVKVPVTWLDRLDEWRSKQRPIPNRSEAIRQIVDMHLDQVELASPGKKT